MRKKFSKIGITIFDDDDDDDDDGKGLTLNWLPSASSVSKTIFQDQDQDSSDDNTEFNTVLTLNT